MMIPIRFGPSARQLFGLYQPASGTDRRECALLCNPFGQEAIRAHRLFRILGDRLASAGLHVLRFDYYGCGDSDGDDSEADLDGWSDDVLRANDEIARHSGCARSTWFGLRLGASIAALASAKSGREPVRMVMLDPVLDGSRYLGELAAAHVAAGKAQYGTRWYVEARLREAIEAEAKTESLGFPITTTLRQQLRTLSAESFAAVRTRQIAILNDGTRLPESLLSTWSARGLNCSAVALQSQVAWASTEAMNTAIVPVDIVQSAVAAMTNQQLEYS